MTVAVVVGAQWGDEGKGKVVDLYADRANVVVRYGGGANAGHTLVVRGEKVVLHLVPSGILHEKTLCILGQGMVVDPGVLLDEIKQLEGKQVPLEGRLLVSERAHVVMPHHREADAVRERGPNAIGTTKRGIGPAYEDKVARRGLRMGDLVRPETLKEKVQNSLSAWTPIVGAGHPTLDVDTAVAVLRGWGQALRDRIVDVDQHIARAITDKAHVLLEGAQGTLLDVDVGTYPFVTSSTTIAGGACAGAGIGPRVIDRAIGITKAYATRVGDGPFPTELHGELGERIRKDGSEFGATTGRPRRCGWLDIPALRYAVRVNGLDALAVTKLDVLTGHQTIKVCVAYDVDGRRVEDVPFDGFERAKPIYEDLAGWSESIKGCRTRESLPTSTQSYLAKIEEWTKCRVTLASVGPDREQTILTDHPFGS